MTAETQVPNHEQEVSETGFQLVWGYYMSSGLTREVKPQIADFRDRKEYGAGEKEIFAQMGLQVKEFKTHFGRDEALAYLPAQNMRERLKAATRGVAGAHLPVYVTDRLNLKRDKSGFERSTNINTFGSSDRGFAWPEYGSWGYREFEKIEQNLSDFFGTGNKELQLSDSIQEMPTAPWDGVDEAQLDQGPGVYVNIWDYKGIVLSKELPKLIEDYQREIDIALGQPDINGLVTLPLTPWCAVGAGAEMQWSGETWLTSVDRKSKTMPLEQADKTAEAFMVQLRKLQDK